MQENSKVWITIQMPGRALPDSPVQIDLDALTDTIVYAAEIGAHVDVLEDVTEERQLVGPDVESADRTPRPYRSEFVDDARWRNVDDRRWVIDRADVHRLQTGARS